jgi:hypothetical protein
VLSSENCSPRQRRESGTWPLLFCLFLSFFYFFLKISHQGRDERVVHGRERVEQEHPQLVYPCADLSSQRLKHALALFFFGATATPGISYKDFIFLHSDPPLAYLGMSVVKKKSKKASSRANHHLPMLLVSLVNLVNLVFSLAASLLLSTATS